MAAKKTTKGETSASETKAVPNPVADALARINNKAQDPSAQRAKLTRSLNNHQQRVEKLQQRLKNAEEDQKEKINRAIKTSQHEVSRC